MRDLANASKKKYVITDFVCPLKNKLRYSNQTLSFGWILLKKVDFLV